uniref:Uncharacterized protein n=1 Tax=Strongyloides papillosus TaxID=174720 RepID=A0A0N5C8H7_STREA
MIFYSHILTILFLVNIKFCHPQSKKIKLLEVSSVNNSEIQIKYNKRPLSINFTDLSNGKIRIRINDIVEDEGPNETEERLKEVNLKKNNSNETNDKHISSTTITENDDNEEENYYLQYIIIGLVIFIILFALSSYLCWYFYNKYKKKDERNKKFKKAHSNIKTTITSAISSCRTNENEGNISASNSTALTLPISKSKTSCLSSSKSKVPKLESIKISEEKNFDDTSTLVSMKTMPDHKNLSVKSISTFINALAFFALEVADRETKNKTPKNTNLQSTQVTSKMLTEQYLKSSVPNSMAKVKSSPLKSKITQIVNIGTIKVDDTQDSEEEKNSKSDPPENTNSNSFRSSNVGNVSSIHPSDLSTQVSK